MSSEQNTTNSQPSCRTDERWPLCSSDSAATLKERHHLSDGLKSDPDESSRKWFDLFKLIPLAKQIVKLRAFQFLVMFGTLVGFYFFLIAGFFGSPVGNHNIMIIYVWIFWWFILITFLVPFGSRIWCTVCPFPFFGQWFQRRALSKVNYNTTTNRVENYGLNKPWPKKLSNIWLQNIGFLAMCSFSAMLVTRPMASFIVLGTLIVIATVLAVIFRGRVFCNYVCSVSGFLSLYSSTSMLALRRKDVEVCNRTKPGQKFSFEHGIAPCRSACPAGVDSSSYIALIAEKKYGRALEVIRESMPFPSSCGRICTSPCEKACIRSNQDESVAIRELKKFIGDNVTMEAPPPPDVKRSEKVAVIGSGPAGLSCAYYLAKIGYEPIVYESLPVLGGMLKVGIPTYRLPKNILDQEIDFIKKSGVKCITNTTIGKDITFEELRSRYQSIFIAVGASVSRRLKITVTLKCRERHKEP